VKHLVGRETPTWPRSANTAHRLMRRRPGRAGAPVRARERAGNRPRKALAGLTVGGLWSEGWGGIVEAQHREAMAVGGGAIPAAGPPGRGARRWEQLLWPSSAAAGKQGGAQAFHSQRNSTFEADRGAGLQQRRSGKSCADKPHLVAAARGWGGAPPASWPSLAA